MATDRNPRGLSLARGGFAFLMLIIAFLMIGGDSVQQLALWQYIAAVATIIVAIGVANEWRPVLFFFRLMNRLNRFMDGKSGGLIIKIKK